MSVVSLSRIPITSLFQQSARPQPSVNEQSAEISEGHHFEMGVCIAQTCIVSLNLWFIVQTTTVHSNKCFKSHN